MKSTILAVSVLIAVMLTVPMHLLGDNSAETMTSVSAKNEDVLKTPEKIPVYDSFDILIDGETKTLSAYDYIFGVVAAEMPALYETEALKAQAVAAYTFACYKKAENKDGDYDLTADPNLDQCYITEAAAREKWGESADEYVKKIGDAVRSVQDEVLTYDGKIALTVYHAISSGTTAAAADVWGKDIPYLTEVESTGDKLSNGYLSEVSLTAGEVSSKLSALAEASGEAAEWFKDITTTEGGRVISLNFCGKSLTGGEIQNALGLRSANFKISLGDGVFTFDVTGYGHGVGMSQTGADYMAKQGSDYKEILYHYYPGCTIQS